MVRYHTDILLPQKGMALLLLVDLLHWFHETRLILANKIKIESKNGCTHLTDFIWNIWEFFVKFKSLSKYLQAGT